MTKQIQGHNTHQSQVMDHSGQPHMVMDHGHDPADQIGNHSMTAGEDCCDADCTCPANACTSFSLLSSYALIVATPVFSEQYERQPIALTSALSTSLYRPPIVA